MLWFAGGCADIGTGQDIENLAALTPVEFPTYHRHRSRAGARYSLVSVGGFGLWKEIHHDPVLELRRCVMKVLGLMGSPRRDGNTHILMRRLMDGCSSLGAKTKIIELAGMEIGECDGCHACWRGIECPRADDVLEVYDLIEGSDALVFGTPVYWYGPTGLMKLLIDRMVYFNCPDHRRRIRGKIATYVIPFEESDLDTVKPVEDFFRRCFRYLELDTVEGLTVPGVSGRGEVSGSIDVLEEAYNLGRRIVSGATHGDLDRRNLIDD